MKKVGKPARKTNYKCTHNTSNPVIVPREYGIGPCMLFPLKFLL